MTAGADTAPVEALEQAAFASWPALETAEHQGWALRFAGGYTKRANSANSTAAAAPLDAPGLAALEAAFAARGLPTIVRLCSAHAVSTAADALLAAQGYARVDPSLVLWRPLDVPVDTPVDVTSDMAAADGLVHEPDAATWLAAYQRCTGQPPAPDARHLAMLRAIAVPHTFGLWRSGSAEVACALAVAHPGGLGLFDVATDAAARRQGHARALCLGLMAWGQAQGVRRAYLQVVGHNTAALALYAELGFRQAYRYHYRVGPSPM